MATHTFDDGVDVDIAPAPSKKNFSTVYDQFRSELGKPVTVEKEIVKPVPARKAIKVKFSTEIDLDQINRWRTKSKKSRKSDEIDLVLFNEMVIASQCRGFIIDGKDVYDENEDTVTFSTQGFMDSLNALTVYGAIKELYVRDSDILRVGDEILEAAGYGESDFEDETDPLD